MANLSEIVNCLFVNRTNYKTISKEDKEKNFFIINRYMSKKYPTVAQALNYKGMDKETCLDMWFMLSPWKNDYKFLKYAPSFFWSKTENIKKTSKHFDKKEIELLLEYYSDLRIQDFDYLYEYHRELITDELKYLKELNK